MTIQKRILAEIHSKLDQAITEKEGLQQSNAVLLNELNSLKVSLAEKDGQIEQLIQEGLKLSKQELNHSNIIKKLRSKEKETEEVLNILKFELINLT